MRFDQLRVVKEDASSDARARQQGQGLVTMSMADLYDMMNQPYPLNQRGQTLPGWFEPRTFAVGQEEGMLSPQMASAYNEWVQGGRLPGLLPDPDTGELRPYNENSYLLDFSYGFAEGAFQLAGDLTRGVAYASDTLDNFLGVSDSYHMTRAASETWMDDFADFFNNQTDLDYRDRATLMQNAIQTPGDVLSLVTGGDVWNDINFQGFGAMIATELPSEILDVALMTSGLGGIAAGIGLNAAEAGGAAVQEVFQSINRLYDEGELQETQQWRVAQELAAESLRQQGLTEGSQEWNDRLDTLAIEVIQDSTLQSNYIRATAGTGAVLDSAADLLIYRRLGAGVVRNAMARMVAAPTIEGSDEALQQIFINKGLTDGTGVPIDEFEGAINAFYQGAVIGGAAGAAATTIDTARSIDQGRQAAQAKLRQFFFGDDYNNIRAIIQIMGMDPALLVNRVRDPNTGRLNLTGLLDTSIPTEDQLSRGQLKRLARTGALNINGRRITRGQIERATRNMGLMSMLENANYDPSANRWNITYQSEDDLREVLQLFGVDTEELSTNEAMREIESILNIDMRVEGRSELEAPIWTDLNARQREEYINTGFVTQFDDPRRQGQRWTREDILDNSFSYERAQGQVIVPDSIINLAMPTDARPTIENSDMAGEVADLQLQIDNNPNVFAARRDLEGDQRAWDEYANENGRDAAIEELGNRPSESDPEWQERFTAASSSTSALQARINQIRAEIGNDQAMWDAEYGDTHYRDGTPRTVPLTTRTSRGETPTQDDGSTPGFREPGEREVPQAPPTDDAETVDDTQDDTQDDEVVSDQPPEVMSTAPNTPSPASDLARAHVVYNVSLRLANKALDPLSVRTMFDRLEQTFPGISEEVLGEGGVENYVQNPDAVEEQRAEELKQNPPEMPELQVGAKPPRGTEITVDGITYRFLGAMWGRVTENGTVDTGFVRRDRSNGPNNTDLTTQWQTETIPELNTAPPQTIETGSEDDGTELAPPPPETRDSGIEEPGAFTPPQLTPPPARAPAPNPENDLRPPETDPAEPVIPNVTAFVVPPEQPDDANIASDTVSQEVQDEYAAVVATRNGIKIQQFLNDLPPEDAAFLRLNPPAPVDAQTDIEQPVTPGTQDSEVDGTPADDQNITQTTPATITAPQDSDEAPVVPDQTDSPEVQTDIEQPVTPGTQTTDFEAPAPETDLRRDNTTPPRPVAPNPETSLRTDDTVVPDQTDGPEVQTDIEQPATPGTQDSEIDTDTTPDTTVRRDTPPSLTSPEIDVAPEIDTTTDQTRDQETDQTRDQETDQTRDQEQDREQQTEPQDDRTQDAPINIVDPDTTVATTTAVGTRDPNAQTGARTTGTRDQQRRTPRPGGTGAVTPPKFDFGKLKPVQVADPEDLNKFRRVT